MPVLSTCCLHFIMADYRSSLATTHLVRLMVCAEFTLLSTSLNFHTRNMITVSQTPPFTGSRRMHRNRPAKWKFLSLLKHILDLVHARPSHPRVRIMSRVPANPLTAVPNIRVNSRLYILGAAKILLRWAVGAVRASRKDGLNILKAVLVD